ncbi:hypothetical protein NXY56_000594 [Leishmania guyanensis]
MQRRASRRGHAEPGLSPVSWLCRTRCTFPYASSLVAQGVLVCCTAAALPEKTPQRADAAAQARCCALSRGRSVTTVPRQSSFPLSNRWRQPFRLVGAVYLVTQQSTLHTASSPPAFAELTPPGCNGSDSHFSAPITPAAAAEAGSTPRGVGPRKRQAKRAVASSAAVETSAEQREEKGNSQGRQLSDASGEHRRPTDQSLSAAAPLQRVSQSAGKRESASDSEFNVLEALRLPAPPTRDTATPESICSYLLTLRRVVSVNRTGTHLVSITGRAALVFMRQILPSLMTMPPVPEADLLTGAMAATAAPAGVTSTTVSGSDATVKRSDPESGVDSQSADTARGIRHTATFAHPSFPPQSLPRASRQSTHEASPVSADVPKWYRVCGTGTVPWTEPLAEAVLLMCNRLNVEVRHLWIARAALLYLASVERKDCADARQPLPTTLGATPSSLTRTLASALKDKAQLALALMRTLDRNRRQSRLTREVLRPVAMRSALRLRAKQNGAASAGGLGGCDGGGAAAAAVAASVGQKRGDTRVSGMDGDGKVPTPASLAPHGAATLMPQHASSFVNLERYLADKLLPLLYGEFVHYCHAVEQWRDNNLRAATQSTVAAATVAADTAAAAAAAPAASRLYQHAPSPGALDDRAFLPNISRSDLETFSLLSAVLHRAIGLHGVVRCGDEVHFDLNEHSPDAYTPVGPRSLGIVSGLSGDVGPSADHPPCGRERPRGLLPAAGSVGALPPPRSPQCQPAIPLRSFRITIEAVAARLDAAGGPHTGALESIASGGVRPYGMDGYAIQIDSPPPFVPPHSATGAGVSRSPSDGSSGRFLSSSSSSSTLRFGRPAAPSPARSPRAFSATAPSPSAGHKEHSDGSKGQDSATRSSGAPHTTTTTAPLSFKAFGNFNVDGFLPILSLCLHDYSFHLFLTAAADDTRARDVVRCATGNTSSVSPATAAEVSALVEEDVSALAAAVSRLLLLGVYWAPLCRTYQLPAVLALFARVATSEPTHTNPEESASAAAAATMASLHPALSPPTAASLSTGATPVPLDTMVLRRVRGTLLPPSDSLATPSSPFVQQLCRLAYSSGCYMERVNFDTFARLTSILDRVLSQWPMQHADVTAAASTCSLSDTTNAGFGGASGDGVSGSGGVAAATAATASSGGELLLSAAATSGQSRDTVARAAGTTSVTGTVGTAVSHAKGSCAVFCAPPAAGMAVLHFFTPIAESFWSRERGRTMWQSIPRRTRQHLTATSSVPFGRAREKGFLGFNTYTYPYTQLRVSVPHVAGDTTAAPDGVRDVLPMPLYVLRQMGMNVGGAERTSTPDELLRVYQTSERVESYMAVLNGVGCATAARPFICEYLRSDFMWRAIPNDAFAPLVTAVMELELTSMPVPELLSLSGSLEDSAGPKHHHTASSSLPGRLSGCLSPQTMMSLNARVEPHELRLLTADNEDTRTLYEETDVRKLLETVVTDSRHGGGKLPLLRFTLRRISRSGCVLESPPSSTTTSAAGPHTDGPGGTASLFTLRPAPHQGAEGARKLKRFPGTPTCHSFEWMADLLWEPAYSRSSDESARLPLAALPPILRAMTLLAEAERRVDGASPGSRACYSGPESLNVHNVELILRMAYRLLFDTVAEASAGAEPPAVVSLEALVTLYLSLTSVASQWGAASSPMRAEHSHVATPKPAEKPPVAGERVREGGGGTRSSGLVFMSLAVECCLAHCEDALRPRLMAIAHDTLVSGMDDAAPMKRESVATDLRALLQLAVLAEGLLPCLANMSVPVTAAAGASVNELIHRQLFRELGASLREASLQKIAGEVSRMLWWVTRRAHAEVNVEGALPLPPLTSWAETLLQQEISAKRLPMADRAITAADATAVPSAVSWCSGMSRQSFDLFEWALLPFYAKLEARQNVSNSAASAMTVDRTSAAPPRPPPTPAPMLDDFLSLEDAYSEPAAELATHVWPPQSSSHGLATGFSSGATTGGTKVSSDGSTTAFYPSGPSAAPHTATLEAALHALPFQCDSFHVLLHIVRQLFLSHPVLLSTAPEAVLYYELRTARTAADDEKRITDTSIGASAPEHIYAATVGRKAWATLPVQRAELPHGLRQRYVDTLFRFFKRLVHHHSCTAEELVELLHLLWLADPHASHVTSSGLSSSSTTVSTSQWPSLFAHCSSFVKASLAELDAAAAMRDTSDSFKGDNDLGASSSLLRSVPEVLQTVYRTAHYGLAKSITVKSREMHWISVNAAALHPRSVVFFLQCLNTVVRGLGEHRQQRVSAPQSLSMPRLQHHEQQERTHHSLSCSHRSALELFQPFIICASITGEPMAGVAKLCYVPLMLEALSQMDPKLLLVVIQTVFTGAAWSGEGGRDQHDGGGGGGGAVNSRREVTSAGSGHFYRKALAGSQTGLGSTRMREKGHIQSTRPSVAGGLQTSQRLSESIAATMAALLMVASYAQASSRVWVPSGGAGGDEDGDSTVATTPATPQHIPLARIGRAQRSALIFLRSSLFELLSLARSRHPLQCVSAFTVVQVMQLTVVQESPRLARLLEWILLSQLLPPVLRVERDIFPAATNRPPRCGSGYVATPSATLPKFSTPTSTAATPARHDSLKKYGVTITEDTIGRMRFPATHQSVLLLRLLPVQCWRSLLHRNVCWPRYRGYSLQVFSRRLRSPVVTRGETHTADTARDRSIAKWNEVRSSLASLLLSLDVESIECLVAEAMGPMVLLVVTTELLRVVARQRTCSGDNLTTLRKDAEGLTRAVGATLRSTPHADDCQLSKADKGPASIAEPSGAANDTPSPAALTSYEAVHCYASPGSVLTDEAVQPWLKAACNVIDQLASTRHTDFVAVLEREAAWQRRVTEASTYQGGATEDIPLGVYKQTAVEAMKAMRAVVGATRGGAPEDAAPVLDIGEDGLAEVSDIGDSGEGHERASLGASAGAAVARDDLSALGSSGGGGATTMGFVATKTTVQDSGVNRWLGDSDKVAAQPLVLDWRPIAEFMRVVRQVDPGISQRQVRLEWWMRQPALATGALVETPVAQSASLAEAALASRVDDAHDVLHNAISATLQHTRQHWQAADKVDGVQPLLVMNLRDALNIYPSNEQNVCSGDDSAAGGQLAIPMCEDGAAEAASRLGASAAQGIIRDSVEVVEQARWLEYGADSSVFVDGSSDPATSLSGFATTVLLGLARPCSALSVSSIHSASTTSSAATVDEHKRRRLVLLRRAGVLASVQEMEQRYRAHRLSGAMWRDGTVASEGACEANFWRQKSQQLQREMLRCIFGGDDSTAGALQRSHASDSGVASKDSAGASGEEVASAAGQSRMNRCMSYLERSARHRLQLLRCNDLAQLLLLLTSATSAASPPQGAQDGMKEGTDVSPSLRGLQIRVVMDTMAELLPSASTGELMQVALALLKLSISATTLTGTASTDVTTPQLLHEVHLEARRLLANVAVLVANDVERFTLHELLWLITRLHTPCIRAAPAVAVPPHAQTTQQADSEAAGWRKTHRRPTHDRLLGDEPLDVSMSYVSVAVARAIRVSIEGSSAPTGGERGDNADDEDDDGTGGSCDEAAALDGDVSVHAQSVAPVTVAQWVNAVAAAERLQGRSHLCLVLRLVERSAV